MLIIKIDTFPLFMIILFNIFIGVNSTRNVDHCRQSSNVGTELRITVYECKGKQHILYQKGDAANILVKLKNLPKEVKSAELRYHNKPLNISKTVSDGHIIFKQVKQMLLKSYNNTYLKSTLVYTNDSISDVALVNFSFKEGRTGEKHACLKGLCVVEYVWKREQQQANMENLTTSINNLPADNPKGTRTSEYKINSTKTVMQITTPIETSRVSTRNIPSKTYTRTSHENSRSTEAREHEEKSNKSITQITTPIETSTVSARNNPNKTNTGTSHENYRSTEATEHEEISNKKVTVTATPIETSTASTVRPYYQLPIHAYIIPAVIGCSSLAVGALYLYRRKRSKDEEDNSETYNYVHPISYAQLDLQPSELYGIPNNNYVAMYTRIIGVLKPK